MLHSLSTSPLISLPSTPHCLPLTPPHPPPSALPVSWRDVAGERNYIDYCIDYNKKVKRKEKITQVKNGRALRASATTSTTALTTTWPTLRFPRHTFSKVLSTEPLCWKCPRPLNFQNVRQPLFADDVGRAALSLCSELTGVRFVFCAFFCSLALCKCVFVFSMYVCW